MQSLLDAPMPKSAKDVNDEDKRKKKKVNKKKKKKDGSSNTTSLSSDLLGLEDSADINTGGADVSLEQSAGSASRGGGGGGESTNDFGMDELSKIAGEGGTLDQQDS